MDFQLCGVDAPNPCIVKDQLYTFSRINLSMATLTLENGRNEAGEVEIKQR